MVYLCRWLLVHAALAAILFGGHDSHVVGLPLRGKATVAPLGHRIRHRGGQRRAKSAGIELIKDDLLAKLGFDEVPDVSKFGKAVSPQELRRKLKEYRRSLVESKKIKETSHDDPPLLPEIYHRIVDYGVRPSYLPELNETGRVHLYFPLSISQPEDPYKLIHVHSAKLKVNIMTSSPEAFHNYNQLEEVAVRISVYQLVPRLISGHHVTLRRLLDSKMVALSSSGWLTFDVREAVDEWLDDPDANWGVELACDDRQSDDVGTFFTFFLPNPSLGVDRDLVGDFLPQLSVLTQEREILSRSRRSDAATYDCDDDETKCCRVPVVIDFRQIGWEFIVEPKTITVYYCSGTCPNGYRPAHNFVSVQSLLHRWKPKDIPAPCCAPDALEASDFFLMYDKQGHLVQEQIDNFIVQSCKCT